MKDQTKQLATTSRRKFAKTAGAALVSLPFISACAPKHPGNEESATPRPASPDSRGFATKLGPGIEDHIPPMGLTDGSVIIDLYDSFNPAEGEKIGDRWRYKIPTFGNIGKVMVTVTNEMDLYTQYYSYIGRPFCDPQNIVIKLWLQQKSSTSNEYDRVDTSLPPEVVISSPGMLQLEVNEKLGKKAKSKHPYRPWKYEHEGNGYPRHFRIGALDISTTNCPANVGSAHWVTRNFDHYQVWIFGPDIDHL